MLLTLLSMFGGGLMRALPEIFGFFNKKEDNSHELALMDKQLELEKVRGSEQRATVQLQGDISETLALLDAQKEALKGQMQLTGIRWVDALNMLVRPLTTYYFLGFYGMVKTSMVVVAMRTADPFMSVIKCWSVDDAAVLAGILSFWFVGRVFDKQSKS